MRSSFSLSGAVIALVVATSGCSQIDSGYQGGELGNGGFYLSCDDAVACAAGTDDAKKFPKTVAVGSTFSVRFTNTTTTNGTNIKLTSSADRGITIDPVGTFVTRSINGLSGQKPGIATIAAHDASGQLIDFVNVEIGRPDALVIYDAADPSGTTNPYPIVANKLSLESVGDRRTLKAFAQRNKATLAGTLAIEWVSNDPSIFDVETTSGGEATIVAIKTGTATLTATGGTYTQSIQVTVQ